ncbi:MAG: hypothetical protein SAJ12_08245 [Jaaginema sp. PMC 1079.18]|nr:hypothetical protein [Jaaginema sp. PMC 1080.18]MEC4850988.1 hypothetical protein [Jaaginema sp. PMC 1079.18]MEC4865115.1 hypothetical protein [Jaaginema sp. PMC 1078.18]
MSYSQFQLEQIEPLLGLNLQESRGWVAQIEKVAASPLLQEIIEYNLPLALEIATEKARSEMILTPILIELKKRFNSQISLFSGREFNIDPNRGLVGFCDFLISQSPSQLIIKAPVAIIVEAKNDNIQSGLGQCIASMYAAQIFNQRQDNQVTTIYGSVTTGTNWKFLRLTDNVVEVDVNEYFLSDLNFILGVLSSFITL